MNRPNKTLTTESGQIALHLHNDPTFVICEQQNLKKVDLEEYINSLKLLGNNLQLLSTGRVLADFSKQSNNRLSLKAAAISHVNRTIIEKAPYFLLAILRSKNFFTNLQLQATLSTGKSLSKKFIDAKMFDTKADALTWLLEYDIPSEYINR